MSRLRVALIGGTGFVGSHLVRHLLAEGAEVFVLNRGSRQIAGTRHMACDRRNPDALKRARDALPLLDLLVDCCAYDAAEAEAAYKALGPKAKQWFHISSAAVYADTAIEVPDEDAPIGGAPVWGDYGVGKSAIDRLFLTQYANQPIRIIRPPYIYGPGNDSDRETFVWARCHRGQAVYVPGDGSTRMQFIHVGDLAQIIFALAQLNLEQSAMAFNVGDVGRLSQAEWVAAVATAAGYADPTVCLGERHALAAARDHFPFRAHPCVLDTSRLAATLADVPTRDLGGAMTQIYQGTSLALLDNGSPLSQSEITLARRIGGPTGARTV